MFVSRTGRIHDAADENHAGLCAAPVEAGVAGQRDICAGLLWWNRFRAGARHDGILVCFAVGSTDDHFFDGRDEVTPEVAGGHHHRHRQASMLAWVDYGSPDDVAVGIRALSLQYRRCGNFTANHLAGHCLRIEITK